MQEWQLPITPNMQHATHNNKQKSHMQLLEQVFIVKEEKKC